jgi:Ca2+-binding RTX toxin-like protein
MGVTERDVIDFNIAGTVVDDLTTELRGLSDIAIVQVSGRWLLVVASEADSAITTFDLGSDGAPVLVDSQSFTANSGTRTIWRLNFAQSGGDYLVLPATRYEEQTVFYKLRSTGTLSTPTAGGIAGEGLGTNETVEMGASTYVFAQNYGGQVLTVYRLNADQALVEVQVLTDTNNTFLGDISALEHVSVGSSDYLLVASAFDAGVSSYRIGNDGRLSLVDTVEPQNGSGFAKAQALVAMETGGRDFVVMAAAGTSSLTVYQVDAAGKFTETDHIIDSLDTRFQGASVLEAFTFEGRQFLVAAGSDDGITVLELWDDGSLHVEASLADTYDITLANVSGLTVEIINGMPVLFVSSATDHGFTRIELSIGSSYREISGNFGDNTLVGGAGNDKIFAGAGNDLVDGGQGDDWLEDGSGEDRLTGGAGADVFSFVQDGQTDVIMDFDLSEDTIDFSGFSNIDSFADLRVVAGCGGVLIYAGGEFLKLEVAPGTFGALDLTASHFDF